jgi:hypothetical protein
MLIKVIEKDDRKKKKMGRKRGDYNTAKETFMKKLRSLKEGIVRLSSTHLGAQEGCFNSNLL